MEKEKFFLSTAIDYVNSFPHLGHALEKIQADTIARFQRELGKEVFFLTGTDENSLKSVKSAQEKGISPEKLVEQNAKRFYQLKDALNLSFDDFIRTTQERHQKGAQKLWLACKKDIYKKEYKGLYCVGCEEFYKKEELIDQKFCPEHLRPLELVEEENYFFSLSKYQERIKKIIEKDVVKIIPQSRKNEVLSFIERGLEDICISRSRERAKGWGIEVPGDSSQIIWCWFDALSNYITALTYSENSKKFQDFWQKNNQKVHIIGKGILRFHAIYWLGILLSANLPLPTKIFVHGYLTIEGRKMSKSLANVVDPFELVEKYGQDPLRYFLLREISPIKDSDFKEERLKERYNSDLANGIGNLVARILTLAEKSKVPLLKFKNFFEDKKLEKIIFQTKKEIFFLLENFKFNEALTEIWKLISFSDKYLEEKRPWEDQKEKFFIINDLLLSLIEISKLLKPFLPKTSEKIIEKVGWDENKKRFKFFPKKGEVLFPKI